MCGGGDQHDCEGLAIDATPPGPLGQATPADVAIDRDAAVTVTWADGHRTRLPLAELRRDCPCAGCGNLRRAGRAVWNGEVDRLRIAGAELVGGWGLGLAWSDGHATGVYEWTALRSACSCPPCRR
ncbi:MAG TPA: DUF971 domain-containing protein [Euzebyales bacterium]|nr:DUF971 domain-containing protein [Euzebyales bacterium]